MKKDNRTWRFLTVTGLHQAIAATQEAPAGQHGVIVAKQVSNTVLQRKIAATQDDPATVRH